MSLTLRHMLAFAVGVLMVLAGVDIALRLTTGQFDQPLLHYSSETQLLANDLDELRGAGVQSDLTFIGSSMVGRAVFPQVFESAMPGVESAHNLGLPAASTEVAHRWATGEVVPALNPRCIVWGVSSMDFNSGRYPQPTIELYEAATATRPGWSGTAERVVNDVWATYRYRHVLLDWIESGDGVGLELRERAIDERGDFDKTEWTSSRNEFETMRIENEVLNNFRVGESELEALRVGVPELSAGAEVVVVSMPVPPSYIDRHPNGIDDFAAFRTALAAEVTTIDVTLIDASDWMSEDDFHDYTHLSGGPAQEFSARLAEEFARSGFCQASS